MGTFPEVSPQIFESLKQALFAFWTAPIDTLRSRTVLSLTTYEAGFLGWRERIHVSQL
jgi:hypothetical protein